MVHESDPTRLGLYLTLMVQLLNERRSEKQVSVTQKFPKQELLTLTFFTSSELFLTVTDLILWKEPCSKVPK